MNFLAHAFLSGRFGDFLLGNFIADSIKGKQIEKLSDLSREGVRLHRLIDSYTDEHHQFKKSCAIVEPYFKRYSGVVVDIYFDHFLSAQWDSYCTHSLADFSQNIYSLLQAQYPDLPPRTQRMLPFMIEYDWLMCYSSLTRLDRIFNGMSRRASFQSNMGQAVPILSDHYDELEKCFAQFFPDMQKRVFDYFNESKQGPAEFWLPREDLKQ